MKIALIGHPGSGKSTFAHRLADQQDIPWIDIDTLFDTHPYYLFFRSSYRRALTKLYATERNWIIDGYHGPRMTDDIWLMADYIMYFDLPRASLKQNIWKRYRQKRAAGDNTHAQATIANTIKNLAQLYLEDASMRRHVRKIKCMIPSTTKFITCNSQEEVEALLLRPELAINQKIG